VKRGVIPEVPRRVKLAGIQEFPLGAKPEGKFPLGETTEGNGGEEKLATWLSSLLSLDSEVLQD
jgi:hypothetical protein